MPGTLTSYEQEIIINNAEDIVTEANHQPDSFFCHACLDDKPATEASPDPRYCQWCYDFLLKEAEILGPGKCSKWVPRATQTPVVEPVQPASGAGHNNTGTPIGSGIMSTVKANNKRGPKHKALPVELIVQWAGQGMGSKTIASKLNSELGINVSYKTIQRTLAGERER